MKSLTVKLVLLLNVYTLTNSFPQVYVQITHITPPCWNLHKTQAMNSLNCWCCCHLQLAEGIFKLDVVAGLPFNLSSVVSGKFGYGSASWAGDGVEEKTSGSLYLNTLALCNMQYTHNCLIIDTPTSIQIADNAINFSWTVPV